MIALTDDQLAIVQHAARLLPVENRDVYLQRIAALLAQRSGRYCDADVAAAAEISLRSLTAGLDRGPSEPLCAAGDEMKSVRQ